MADHLDNEVPPKNRAQGFRSTRAATTAPESFDPAKPRLGRRESEPHSNEVNYLHDVLATNFPQDRTMWDLHHYFNLDGYEYDIQFDITFFRDISIPYTLSSYKAADFGNRVPTMAINVLSKRTWMGDIGEHVDDCRALKIPLYVVFSPYYAARQSYTPPFLRIYQLNSNGDYTICELRVVTMLEGGAMNIKNVLDAGDVVPFRFGLIELQQKHENNKPLYRLILIDKVNDRVLLTPAELAKEQADQEKEKADQEKEKADQEKERADQEKERADAAEARIHEIEERN
jgi:hypothetical protein